MRRTFQNAAWLTGARFGGEFLNFLFFVMLSRRFGPAGIGVYAYAGAVGGLVYAAVHLGLEEYGIRESARRHPEARRRLLAMLFGTQLTLAVLTAIGVAVFLLASRPSPEATWIILLLSSHQACIALARTLFVPAFADQAMGSPARVEFACRIGAIAVSFVLVVGFGLSMAPALVPFPLSGLALLAFAIASARRHNGSLPIRWSPGASRGVLVATWPFALSVIVQHVNSRVDVILLSLMRGDATAGIYVSSIKFVEVGGLSLFFLGVAFYPPLSQLARAGGQRFLEAVEVFTRGTLMVGGLLAWAIYYILPPILVWILGEPFRESMSLLRWLALLPVVTAFETVAMRVLLARDLHIERVRMQSWATLAKVAMNLAWIPLFGSIGAVWALIAGALLTSLLYLRPISASLDIRSMLRPLWIAVLCIGVGGGAGELASRLSTVAWLPHAASIVVFSCAAVALGLLPLARIRSLTRRSG